MTKSAGPISPSERRGYWLAGPAAGWLVLFFLAPTALIIGMSFMRRDLYGGVGNGLTLDHYRRLLDPLYLKIVWRTVWWAAACTVSCLVLGYPVAFTIARAGARKNLLLFLVMLPFWTSLLVRTFAIIFLLRDTGLINSLLLSAHLIDQPIALLYTPGAVIIGLISGFLPLMILPIYASLERLDDSVLESIGQLRTERFRKAAKVVAAPLK
jgi:spermidine/putrescine transport system permease protein